MKNTSLSLCVFFTLAVTFCATLHAESFPFDAPSGPKFSDAEKAAQRVAGEEIVRKIREAFDAGAAKSASPNVIFILTDDLGYGDLSCYGQKEFSTPKIDSLAADGMKFTQFYAGSTVCAPSRCALMTGLHTGHGYVRGNRWDNENQSDWPLPDGTPTVAKVFQQAGYATGMFGKWGLGKPGGKGSPDKMGFDRFFGVYSQLAAHNHYPPALYDGETKIELDGKAYAHDLFENRALDFIRKNKDKPFFCYLSVTIPHAAMQVPESYMTPWREKYPQFENVTGNYTFNTSVRNPVAAFPAMMTRLDETVGKVRATLEELGIDENTMIIFTSDNGPHHEGGHRPAFFGSSGAVRGTKRDLTDGGIRVPFIVHWPARVKKGTVNDHVGAFWDFLPTVCNILDENPPATTDGISFLPTLEGDDENQKQHDYLYWEFHEQGGKQAARWGDYKGIRTNVNKAPNGPIAVYDLSKDLREEHDISNENPEIVKKFREIFKEARVESEFFKF